MATVRKRLCVLIENKLYMFCRYNHDRTYYVINFFMSNCIINDEELLQFFNNCDQNTCDPRSNPIFREEKWPDLTVKTQDDENGNILELLDEYEKDIPIILLNMENCFRPS